MANIWVAERENQADAKVFKVKYEGSADLLWCEVNHSNKAKGDALWYFVDRANQADFKIYWVDYEGQADIKVCEVKYTSSAKWKKSNKFQNRLS